MGAIGVGAILAPALIEALGSRGAMLATGLFLPVLAVLLGRRVSRLDAVPVPETELALLRGIDIFAPLPPPVLESVARSLVRVRVEAGRELFRQGELGDRFYIVAEGRAEIVSDGRPVAVTVAGGYFGEIALLRDVPRTATVRALTDLELFALEREDFIAAVTGHAASADAADAVVATRLSSLRPGLASV